MDFFPTQKDVRADGLSMPLRSLSQTRVALTILWERMDICVHIPCSCFLRGLYRADGIATIVLTMQSNLPCNDDYP